MRSSSPGLSGYTLAAGNDARPLTLSRLNPKTLSGAAAELASQALLRYTMVCEVDPAATLLKVGA